jgi:protein-L-isoaspartate O-methyltransferase
MKKATTEQMLTLAVACDVEAIDEVASVFAHYGFSQGMTVEAAVVSEACGPEFAVAPRTLVVASTRLSSADVGSEAFAEARRSLWLVRQALWIRGRTKPIGSLRVIDELEGKGGRPLDQELTVLRVGSHVLVKAPCQEYEALPDETVVELDAGIAFGTGRHLSTQLCMRALEVELRVGDAVLDVGIGSGILAIAAAMRGARSVDGLDIDPVAVHSARANAERNGVGGIVRTALGTVGPNSPFPGPYELVIANIIAGVLTPLAPELARAVAPDGTLIVGGIIDDKEAMVHEAFASTDLTLARRIVNEDWVALVWRKPHVTGEL